MSYKGKYKIKNPEKYLGDYTKVVYRSLWERQAFKWCESNSRIRAWNSEEVVIPYKCKTDNRIHRYFIDLFIEMDNGDCILVEIKPKKQTTAPKKPSRKTKSISTKSQLILRIPLNGLQLMTLLLIKVGSFKYGLKTL